MTSMMNPHQGETLARSSNADEQKGQGGTGDDVGTLLAIHIMPPRAKPKAPADDGQEDSPAESKAASKPKGKTRAKVGEGDDNDAAPAQGLSEEKLPLPAWLKMFTERGVDMRLAMTLAAKL